MSLPFRCSLLALGVVLFASPGWGLARWEGDALNNNNPPAQNGNLPNGLKSAILRVKTQTIKDGVLTSRLASGALLDTKRDGPEVNTGRISLITCDHNTAIPQGEKVPSWTIAFGNGQASDNSFRIRKNDVMRPPLKDGKRPDVAVLGAEAEDWSKLPAGVSPAPVKDQDETKAIVQAGFGRAGTVNTTDRRYHEVVEFGTLRIGSNMIDRVFDHTTGALPPLNVAYAFRALESSMQFAPQAGAPTSGESHTLDADSGGPTFQDIGGEWRLVGVHSESDIVAGAPNYVREGNKQWDVRLAEYSEFIKTSTRAALGEREEKEPSPRGKEGKSGQSPVSYDGDSLELSFPSFTLTSTGFVSDPALGSQIEVPLATLLAVLGSDEFLFDTDTTAWLTVVQGSTVYLRGHLEYLTCSPQRNLIYGRLAQFKLANAAPSQPFYDPGMFGPDSPWLAALRLQLASETSQYDPNRKLWFVCDLDDSLSVLTDGFTTSGAALGSVSLFAHDTAAVPTWSPAMAALLPSILMALGVWAASRRRPLGRAG